MTTSHQHFLDRYAAALPSQCCGRCSHWARLRPDDETAPEGRCGLPTEPVFWPFGCWPNTLQRDRCSKFNSEHGDV